MNSLRGFVRKHRRKILVAVGVVGGGYALYRVISAYNESVLALEPEKEAQRRADELSEARLQAHFETIQKISDSITLPFVLDNLKTRLHEELDISELTERLMQGRGQPHALSAEEKFQLWERLKFMSFTRTACALWAVTMLNLYIRVQLNILGRHLYIDAARGFEALDSMEQSSTLSNLCQHKFLASADYLPHHGVITLIADMQKVAENILQSKHLREPFTIRELLDIFTRILKDFADSPAHWVNYIIPENGILYEEFSVGTSDFDGSPLPHAVLSPFENERAKLEQLMAETRAVLSSDEFKTLLELSLERVLDGMMEEFNTTFEGIASGIPLAKLVPPVAQISTVLLEHPTENRFINIIGSLPQLLDEVFSARLNLLISTYDSRAAAVTKRIHTAEENENEGADHKEAVMWAEECIKVEDDSLKTKQISFNGKSCNGSDHEKTEYSKLEIAAMQGEDNGFNEVIRASLLNNNSSTQHYIR